MTETKTKKMNDVSEAVQPGTRQTDGEAQCKAQNEAQNEAQDNIQVLLEKISVLEAQLAQLRGDDEDTKQVKAFFEAFPGADAFTDDICAYIDAHDGCEGLEQVLLRILLEKYKAPEQLSSDEEFLKAFIVNNERVKEMIISDYLNTLSRTPSACIKRGGLVQTQREKPTTVRAAGELARALFKRQQ